MLKALIEEGLRRVISRAQEPPKPAFKLQNARLQGEAVLMPDSRDLRQLEDDQFFGVTV